MRFLSHKTAWLALFLCGACEQPAAAPDALGSTVQTDLEGASHRTPNWSISCPATSDTVQQMRVRHDVRRGTELAFSSDVREVNGSANSRCSPFLTKRYSGRPPRLESPRNPAFRGPDIELDTQYYISTFDLNTGTRSDWVPFAMLSANDSTFSISDDFGVFQERKGNWEIAGGTAQNSEAMADAYMLANYRQLPFTGPNSPPSGLTVYFEFSTLCTEPPCRLSLIADTVDYGRFEGERLPWEWLEVAIEDDEHVRLNRVDRDANHRLSRRRLANLGTIDPLKLTNTIAISFIENNRGIMRVEINGRRVYCGRNLPMAHGNDYFGAIWTSSGDDPGENAAYIERITAIYGEFSKDGCRYKMPRPRS